jgi:hypothetical protein
MKVLQNQQCSGKSIASPSLSLATVSDMAASRAELSPVLGFRPLQLAESIKATDRVSTGVGEAA